MGTDEGYPECLASMDEATTRSVALGHVQRLQQMAGAAGRVVDKNPLNFLHLGLWFVCLWVFVRFQWSHALGLAIIMWLVMTLAVLPMVFEQAGHRALAASASQREKAELPARWREREAIAQFSYVDARICMISPSWTI